MNAIPFPTMGSRYPDLRTIRRALGVLERLPPAALADPAERLIDHLDTVTPDPDLEPEEEDEALPVGTLRGERDGFVRVWRRRPGRIAIVPETVA